MTDTEMFDRARAKMAEYAGNKTREQRLYALSDHQALRRFIIWCHELGDYGIHECVKTLFNHGYRGRELDLAWKP